MTAVLLLGHPGAALASWKHRIDNIVGHKNMGVSVRLDGSSIYSKSVHGRRHPASNEKLLLAMSMFDSVGTDFRIKTTASLAKHGNLWILGRGDPSVTGGGAFGRNLPFEPTRLKKLARKIKRAGITHVRGRVVGSQGYFSHDWNAPGWKPSFPSEEVALPSALTFEGNTKDGRHVSNPERRAARSLTRKLEDLGVKVDGRWRAGHPPDDLEKIARVKSRPLLTLLRYTLRKSANFFAEVLGKRLGVEESGRPGTISKGAGAIRNWAGGQGADIDAYDSSGLSYSNRISTGTMSRLIAYAEGRSWHKKLRKALPKGGQGTLEDRLHGVRVRAKTGTLDDISALSGWVWLTEEKRWSAFSIMSSGMSKDVASRKEDKIVRILHKDAHGPRTAATRSLGWAGGFAAGDARAWWATQATAVTNPQPHEV